MKRRYLFLFIVLGLYSLILSGVVRSGFGELPPGALINEAMGKTSEIVLYLVFEPSLVADKVPENIRLLPLSEIAEKDKAIGQYLKSYPEHKDWAWSFLEIIGTESLIVDNRTADFGPRGGMAVWYVMAKQKDPVDPRIRGSQMLALGTWISDRNLSSHVREKGLPWEYGKIDYWKDDEGIVRGHVQTGDLEIHAECRLQGEPYKAEFKLPAFQTIWSPLPYPGTFEVITFYGHRVQDCSVKWTFRGSHPLVKAYESRATGGLFISGSEYAFDYVLKGGLYSR